MIELEIEELIPATDMINVEEDVLEETIKQKVANAMMKEMKEHIEEMAFLDMEQEPTTGNFLITAKLVLCSTQDIITNAEVMAQKLASYGLEEDQIIDVIETQLTRNEGF